jgi:hypothetical protein
VTLAATALPPASALQPPPRLRHAPCPQRPAASVRPAPPSATAPQLQRAPCHHSATAPRLQPAPCGAKRHSAPTSTCALRRQAPTTAAPCRHQRVPPPPPRRSPPRHQRAPCRRQAPSTSTALPVAPLRHLTYEIKNQVHATRPPASAPPIVHPALRLCLDCFYTCTFTPGFDCFRPTMLLDYVHGTRPQTCHNTPPGGLVRVADTVPALAGPFPLLRR